MSKVTHIDLAIGHLEPRILRVDPAAEPSLVFAVPARDPEAHLEAMGLLHWLAPVLEHYHDDWTRVLEAATTGVAISTHYDRVVFLPFAVQGAEVDWEAPPASRPPSELRAVPPPRSRVLSPVVVRPDIEAPAPLAVVPPEGYVAAGVAMRAVARELGPAPLPDRRLIGYLYLPALPAEEGKQRILRVASYLWEHERARIFADFLREYAELLASDAVDEPKVAVVATPDLKRALVFTAEIDEPLPDRPRFFPRVLVDATAPEGPRPTLHDLVQMGIATRRLPSKGGRVAIYLRPDDTRVEAKAALVRRLVPDSIWGDARRLRKAVELLEKNHLILVDLGGKEFAHYPVVPQIALSEDASPEDEVLRLAGAPEA